MDRCWSAPASWGGRCATMDAVVRRRPPSSSGSAPGGCWSRSAWRSRADWARRAEEGLAVFGEEHLDEAAALLRGHLERDEVL